MNDNDMFLSFSGEQMTEAKLRCTATFSEIWFRKPNRRFDGDSLNYYTLIPYRGLKHTTAVEL